MRMLTSWECRPRVLMAHDASLSLCLQALSLGVWLQRGCLATSLAGNAVDVLTITAAADRGRPLEQRRGVVLSARVHPGETNASWMMKGALQQLLADTEEAAALREQFVFKVCVRRVCA
jgi:hypothetical protein